MEPAGPLQHQRVVEALSPHLGSALASSIVRAALKCLAPGGEHGHLDGSFLDSVSRGLQVFCPDPGARGRCLRAVEGIVRNGAAPPSAATAAPSADLEIAVHSEQDIVLARRSARQLASQVGFDEIDQAKIATAISELARNIHRYAHTGAIRLSALPPPRPGVRIVARDAGPGIPHLEGILSGAYRSRTGLGLGILGCKRLMDEFAIESGAGKGTCVTIAKYLRRVG
jgi:serine/threonine-protein kinase RsbT